MRLDYENKTTLVRQLMIENVSEICACWRPEERSMLHNVA